MNFPNDISDNGVCPRTGSVLKMRIGNASLRKVLLTIYVRQVAV